MTTIAARVGNGWVEMSSDTQSEMDFMTTYSASKMMVIGGFIVGAAGDLVIMDALALLSGATSASPLDIARRVLQFAGEQGTLVDGELPGVLLIAGPGGVWRVGSNGSVSHCGHYGAIGSGAAVAFGALSADDVTSGAVLAASLHDAGTGGWIRTLAIHGPELSEVWTPPVVPGKPDWAEPQ